MSSLLRTRRFTWLVALAVLLLLGTLGYLAGQRYFTATRWVTHTFEATAAIDSVLSKVTDIETGQRGYLISGDPRFLEPYDNALSALPQELQELERLVSDNARQLRRTQELRARVEEKLSFSAHLVEERRLGHDYMPSIASGKGHTTMVEIRQIVEDMRAEEQVLLAERTERAAQAQVLTIITTLLGAGLVVGLILFSLVMVRRDLHELQEATEGRSAAEAQFRALAEHATDLICLVDAHDQPIYVSPSAERLLGYPPAEFLKLAPTDVLYEDDLEIARRRVQLLRETAEGSATELPMRFINKNGDSRWFDVSICVLPSSEDRPSTLLLSARDAHERTLAEIALAERALELETLSTTDALTGLLNRRGFVEVAAKQLETARQADRALAVVFVDLDGLKPINDRLGHEIGDQAIAEAARVLRDVCRGQDIVARLGGDEFAIIALDLTESRFRNFHERITCSLETLNAQSKRAFHLSFSLGAAFSAPEGQEPLDELLKVADARMYEQKRLLKNSRALI